MSFVLFFFDVVSIRGRQGRQATYMFSGRVLKVDQSK